jgi:hypothetical protein
MGGAIPPLPNMPSWRDAQFRIKAQGQLYLYLLRTDLKEVVFYVGWIQLAQV